MTWSPTVSVFKGLAFYNISKYSSSYTVKENPRLAFCHTEAKCRNVTRTLRFVVV